MVPQKGRCTAIRWRADLWFTYQVVVCGPEYSPCFLDRFSANWISTTIATAGVSYLEAAKEYRRATELLRALLGGYCCPGR